MDKVLEEIEAEVDTNLGLAFNSPHPPRSEDRVKSGQDRHLSDNMALQRLNTQFDMQPTRL